MSEAADARGSGLDPRDRIKVIGRFRPLEPGAEAAPWIVNGSTLTYATGLEPLADEQTPEAGVRADPCVSRPQVRYSRV